MKNRNIIFPNYTVANSKNTSLKATNKTNEVTTKKTPANSNQHLPSKNIAPKSKKISPSKSKTASSTGTSYKVQVVAVNYHDINHPRYNKVKNIGRIETEKVPQRGITRVLITDLTNMQIAEEIKQQVVQYGFVDAFVVKYENGKRVGRIW